MTPWFKQSLLASVMVSMMLIGAAAYANKPAVASQSQANTQAKAPVQLLFVMSAKSGNIAQSGQNYSLTLNDVNPHVLWFTDRPNRRAGFVPLSTFLDSWTKGFAGSPPNAALVHVGMEAQVVGKNQPMVMELSKPSYQQGALTFHLTDLKGDGVRMGRIEAVNIFFDGACGQADGFFNNGILVGDHRC